MAKTMDEAKTNTATESVTNTVTVKALLPITHDDEPHAPGETFSLPAKAAQALVDCGAAEVSQ